MGTLLCEGLLTAQHHTLFSNQLKQPCMVSRGGAYKPCSVVIMVHIRTVLPERPQLFIEGGRLGDSCPAGGKVQAHTRLNATLGDACYLEQEQLSLLP